MSGEQHPGPRLENQAGPARYMTEPIGPGYLTTVHGRKIEVRIEQVDQTAWVRAERVGGGGWTTWSQMQRIDRG